MRLHSSGLLTKFRGLHFAYAYIDDILIASSNPDSHVEHLQTVLERFKKYGVIINPNKCELGVSKLHFLGHAVDSAGIRPLPDKVKAIQEFPLPETHKKLWEFLGLINFTTISSRTVLHCLILLTLYCQLPSLTTSHYNGRTTPGWLSQL